MAGAPGNALARGSAIHCAMRRGGRTRFAASIRRAALAAPRSAAHADDADALTTPGSTIAVRSPPPMPVTAANKA